MNRTVILCMGLLWLLATPGIAVEITTNDLHVLTNIVVDLKGSPGLDVTRDWIGHPVKNLFRDAAVAKIFVFGCRPTSEVSSNTYLRAILALPMESALMEPQPQSIESMTSFTGGVVLDDGSIIRIEYLWNTGWFITTSTGRAFISKAPDKIVKSIAK